MRSVLIVAAVLLMTDIPSLAAQDTGAVDPRISSVFRLPDVVVPLEKTGQTGPTVIDGTQILHMPWVSALTPKEKTEQTGATVIDGAPTELTSPELQLLLLSAVEEARSVLRLGEKGPQTGPTLIPGSPPFILKLGQKPRKSGS